MLVVGLSDNNFKNRLCLSLCNISSEFCWLTKGVVRFVERFCVNCQRRNYLQVDIINDIIRNNGWSALFFLSSLFDECNKQSNSRTHYTHSCPIRSYLPHKFHMIFPTTNVYVCCFCAYLLPQYCLSTYLLLHTLSWTHIHLSTIHVTRLPSFLFYFIHTIPTIQNYGNKKYK